MGDGLPLWRCLGQGILYRAMYQPESVSVCVCVCACICVHACAWGHVGIANEYTSAIPWQEKQENLRFLCSLKSPIIQLARASVDN